MKVTKKSLPNSVVSLTITLSPEDFKKYESLSLRRMQSTVKVDGFRKGHVPETVIRQKIGEEAIKAEAMELALSQSYSDAIESEKLIPLKSPEVKVEKVDPFTFTAEVEVYPEVKVGKIDPKKIKKGEAKIEKKEIDEVIENLQRQVSERKAVERKAKKGDIVEIDFDGTDLEGNPKPGMKSAHHPLEIGSNAFIPGFEEEVIGLSKGDEKTFQITFPADYHHAEYAGAPFLFTVKVHEVLEVCLPEVDENFVEKITGTKKSPDELRTEIEGHLKEKKQADDWKRRQNEFFEMIGDATKTELPNALLEDELGGLLDEIKLQGLQSGIPWEKYLSMLKTTEEDLKKELLPKAQKTVTARLGLQKLLEENNVMVEESEMAKEIMFTISRLPVPEQEKRKKHYKKGQSGWNEVENRLKIRKFFGEQLGEM